MITPCECPLQPCPWGRPEQLRKSQSSGPPQRAWFWVRTLSHCSWGGEAAGDGLIPHRNQGEDATLHVIALLLLALHDNRGFALGPYLLPASAPPLPLPHTLPHTFHPSGCPLGLVVINAAGLAVTAADASHWWAGVGGVGGRSARQYADLTVDHHGDHVQGDVNHSQAQAVGDVVERTAVHRVTEALPHVLQVAPANTRGRT